MAANTVPLTYNDYVKQIGALAVTNVQTAGGVTSFSQAPLQQVLPQMINYAELRIQRDLDLAPAYGPRTYTLSAGSNILSIPTDDFVTLKTAMVNANQTNTPLHPVAQEFIQNVYGSVVSSGLPQYFAQIGGDIATGGATNYNVLIGPYADQDYPITFYGMQRVPSLNKFNTDPDASTKYTFISTYLQDLLIMASMVFVSAYQRNFGRMADDPAMAQSYEGQYQALVNGAKGEEFRKKFQGNAWTSYSTPTAATLGRQV